MQISSCALFDQLRHQCYTQIQHATEMLQEKCDLVTDVVSRLKDFLEYQLADSVKVKLFLASIPKQILPYLYACGVPTVFQSMR